MTSVRFLKIVIFSCLTLFILNGLGSLYFYQKLHSGAIQETSSDGHQGWEMAAATAPTVKLNDMGLREKQGREGLAKDPRPKMVLLGNSVVYGGGIQNQPVFADILREKMAGRFQVINAGKEAIEIWREFEFYRQEFRSMKPRYVIWFPSGNDFVQKQAVKEKQIETSKQNRYLEEFDWDLLWKPYFFQQLAQKIYYENSILQENFLSSPHNEYYTNGILKAPHPRILGELAIEIQRFHQELQQDGTELLVIFLPTKMYSKLYGWESAVAFQQLGALLKSQNIPFFQALDLLHSNCNANCYLDYAHFNGAGHRFLGEELSRLLAPLP